MDHHFWLQGKLQDPEFLSEWDSLELPASLAHQLIRARTEAGLTQEQLAIHLGTKQGSISRLENMGRLPSLSFLVEVASALGYEVKVLLRKKGS